MTKVPIKRALVSVYDKTGLAELAGALAAAGVQIVSTGSTAAAIAAAGVPVTPVEEVTGFPECLDGRVKTLHPAVHAGLLADTGTPRHRDQLAELGIAAFDLLVSNLYPFEATVASGAPAAECVEQIDIGGPAMVRAAAKNHARVAVITAPSQYQEAADAVRGRRLHPASSGSGWPPRPTRPPPATTPRSPPGSPPCTRPTTSRGRPAGRTLVSAVWTRREVLRYGENPHQDAALYVRPGAPPGLATATQLHGKAMSYNNYGDAAAAWRTAFDFAEPCVAIIKHANPCGIAVGADLAEAHRKAHACDPVSAYGGVIAANGVVTAAMAAQVADIFTEVIVAPGFEEAALATAHRQEEPAAAALPGPGRAPAGTAGRRSSGARWTAGCSCRPPTGSTRPGDDPATWELKAGPGAAAAETLADLAFAWRACRAAKSNAIVLAAGGATVGVGMGQVNRVDSARIAVARSGQRCRGAVAASDAFFPFADGLQVLADAGVRAIVEPGGSIRDGEVIAAAAGGRGQPVLHRDPALLPLTQVNRRRREGTMSLFSAKGSA